MRLLVLALAFLSINSFADKKIRIISTTDFHGALDEQTVKTKDGNLVTYAGAALLASYVNKLRQENIPSLLIDAGDLFQGSLISNSAEGRPVVDFYNYMGVDAVAIGNHEFDYGPAGPKAIPKTPADDPRGALKERIAQAKFPFLAANIRGADGKRPDWAKASVLIERGGVKVGVIGVATTTTPSTTIKKNVLDLKFIDPVKPISAEAAKLKAEGADLIVLTIHAGGGCTNNSKAKQNDLTSCEEGELSTLLKRIPDGVVDVVVAGHTHKGIGKFYGGIPVMQSYSHGKDVTWLDATIETNDIAYNMTGPIPVCGQTILVNGYPTCDSYKVRDNVGTPVTAKFLGKEIAPDENVIALLKADFERVEKIKNEPMGVTSEGYFTRSYYDENALANLFTDVLRNYRKDAELVMLNNGGLRDNLEPGPVTYGAVYAVFPFDNALAMVTLNGDQLKKMIEVGVERSRGGYSWDSGLVFSADNCKITSAEVNGQELQPTRLYKVMTVDFIAMGGSGFNLVGADPSQIQYFDDEPVMRDQVAAGLKVFQAPLKPELFFNKDHLRQQIGKICGDGSGGAGN